MPGPSLDPSWRYAINEAVAKGMVFGRDIIFTMGPYGSVYSGMYHPDTDSLILLSSSYLVICFAVTLWLLARQAKVWGPLVVAFCVTGPLFLLDGLFFLYPLLLCVLTYRIACDSAPTDTPHRERVGKWFLYFLAYSPFGFIPLIKGSLYPVCLINGLMCVGYLVYHRQRTIAATILISAIMSLVGFWITAGQPIQALPDFFSSLSPIISGYTEAMALRGKGVEIYWYLGGSALILASVGVSQIRDRIGKLFLLAAFGLFLFVNFKAGFVRHDGHALISAGAILLAAAILPYLAPTLPSMATIVVAFFICLYTSKNYIPPVAQYILPHVQQAYSRAYAGLAARLDDRAHLPKLFEEARQALQKEGGLPVVDGTADIYPFDQAYLLATSNKWAPRPVLQSYSAYTPGLAERDAEYLLGPKAPDYIFFTTFSLDNRVPSMDDGPSWPILLSRYAVVARFNRFLLLHKRSDVSAESDMLLISKSSARLNETVDIPAVPGKFIYAKIELKNSLIGKLASTLLKPPNLDIVVTFRDGSSRALRLISGMAKAGFILSPFIDTPDEFSAAYAGPDVLAAKQVKSIRIVPQDRTYMWKHAYKVNLYGFDISGAGTKSDASGR